MECAETSFIDLLFKKRLMVGVLKDQGFKVNSLLKEVDRQIRQVSKGNVLTGEGVTKSGEED